jgi:hypothetical protein
MYLADKLFPITVTHIDRMFQLMNKQKAQAELPQSEFRKFFE